jgi:UDP-N-acetylmuramate dehydrogenase
MSIMQLPEISEHAPIHTWFGVGGTADRLAQPHSVAELIACVRHEPDLRILGDGANLLVHDRGVRELVVSLRHLNTIEHRGDDGPSRARIWVGAGANLPKFITAMARDGFGGVEGLGGIPATIGGAIVMNAGGRYGEIADVVASVDVLTKAGETLTLTRPQINFAYRRSGLNKYIILGAELLLTRQATAPLRERLKEVMEYKKKSQPMADNSAGCSFKNPTLTETIEGIGAANTRVSAGMVIDRAGCKGLRIGSASVSAVHGNFLTADKGGSAADVIALINEVTRRVHATFGITLEREVVIWGEE